MYFVAEGPKSIILKCLLQPALRVFIPYHTSSLFVLFINLFVLFISLFLKAYIQNLVKIAKYSIDKSVRVSSLLGAFLPWGCPAGRVNRG